MRRCLTFLILFTWQVSAQHSPEHIQYTIDDGLPSMECYDVIKDEQGYVWIGTDRGLVKFNGKDFTVLSEDNGLPCRAIYKFYPDNEGRIWCSGSGITIGYIKEGAYSAYKYNQVIKENCRGVRSDFVIHYNTDEKKLYACGSNIFFSIDEKGIFTKIDGGSLPLNMDREKYIDEIRNNYFSGRKICIRDGKVFSFGINDTLLNDQSEHSITLDQNGAKFRWETDYGKSTQNNYGIKIGETILAACNHELIVIDGDQLSMKRFPSSIIYFRQAKDAENIWIGTYSSGLFLVDKKGNVLQQYFPQYSVSSIFVDEEGNFWFTTLHRGVLFAPKLWLEQVFPERNQLVTLIQMKKEGGKVWALTDQGRFVSVYGKEVKEAQFSVKAGEDRRYIDFFLDHSSIPSMVITPTRGKGAVDILGAKLTDEGFVGYMASNVMFYDKQRVQTRVERSKYYINELEIVGNDVYIGTSKGLYRLSLNPNGIISRFDLPEVNNENILCLKKWGEKGIVFLSSKKGLYRIKDVTKPELEVLLNASFLDCIDIDGQTVWAAGGRRVIRVDSSNDDLKKDYWVTTVSNIRKIVADQSFIYLSNDTKLFSAKKSNFQNGSLIPKLKVVSINSNKRGLTYGEKLMLESDEKQLEVNYVLLAYGAIHAQVRYKLGENDNWVYSSGKGIQLSGLSEGDHQLVVEVSNEIGDWFLAEVIEIHVKTPYWRTFWFYLLMSLLFAAVVFWIARSSIRRKALKTKAAELELSVITQQINPHFIFNSLNSIRGYIFRSQYDEADDYLVRFSKLTRKVLAISRESVTTVEDEMDVLNDYLQLEKMRSGDRFTFSLTLEGTEDELTSIPSMLTQPFVENAVIHGVLPLNNEKGEIHVRFITQDFGLIIEVEDNGVGRSGPRFKRTHKSMGMDIVKDRLALFDENSLMEIVDLKDDYDQPLGTLVRIRLTV